MDEEKVWLDAIGRQIQVGQVITKAYKAGNSLSIQTGVVRNFKENIIEVDFWSHLHKELRTSYIRQSWQATITSLTEEELIELMSPKPLSEVLA